MLRKFTLGLLAFAISNSSFALKLYKATVMSHEESTTGGITAKLKNLPKQRTLNDDNEDNEVHIYTETEEQSITLGKLENIPAYSGIFIKNDSDTTQKYRIYTTTCVMNNDPLKIEDRCFRSADEINIESNGSFENDTSPELLVKFNGAQPLTLNIDVEIARITSSGEKYIGTSSSTADITILQ